MTFILGSSEAKDLAVAKGTNAQEDTPARHSEANDTVGGNTEGDDNKGNKEDDNPSLLSGKKGSRSICKKSPPKLTVREYYKQRAAAAEAECNRQESLLKPMKKQARSSTPTKKRARSSRATKKRAEQQTGKRAASRSSSSGSSSSEDSSLVREYV